MSLSLAFDLMTLAYRKVSGCDKPYLTQEQTAAMRMSAIVPVYNEAGNIAGTIEDLLGQTHPLESVIVVDDHSNDGTADIVKELAARHPNLHYVLSPQPRNGKAANLNYVVETETDKLGDYVYIIDSDIRIGEDHIEKLLSGFNEENVAGVTGRVLPFIPEKGIPRLLAEGRTWTYNINAFRKEQRAARNAIYVMSGCNSAFTKEYLQAHPFRLETIAEDLDQSWVVYEEGFKVNARTDAVARSHIPSTIKEYYTQLRRWQSGGIQCYFTHGGDLQKAKMLTYTTLIPHGAENVMQTGFLLSLPAVTAMNPELGGLLFAGEMGYSMLITALLSPRSLKPKNYPGVLLHKYINAVSFAVSASRTVTEAATGQRHKWRKAWKRVKLETPHTQAVQESVMMHE